MTSDPKTGAAPAPPAGPTPYLAVTDARRAIAWYSTVLGAEIDGDLYGMPDGRVGHAELTLGGGRLMLADEYPELGLRAPDGTTTSVTLHMTVADVDAVTSLAAGEGATVERHPADAGYGRSATIRDPFGHRWLLMQAAPSGSAAGAAAGQPDDAAGASRQGDVVYITLEVGDSARARRFYGDVLGWTFSAGRVEDGWGVERATPMIGLWGGREPTATLMYKVDDVPAAVDRVRAAGGVAAEPTLQPYGWSAECTDDQGVRFYLGDV